MNKLFYLLFTSAGMIIIGSLAIFTVESTHKDSQINSMLDALWWTVATVTTVGYGDVVPVSDAGKIIAMVFMFFGIGVLAIFLSVLGTNFYKKRFEKEDQEITHGQKLILDKIKDLEKKTKDQDKILKEILEKLNKED